jgi:Glu-tRNA(Gln) amidotransferase subunit E-like FAD-binding protein
MAQSIESATRSAFLLVLTAFVSAELMQSAFHASQFFRTPHLVAGVSPLDSFSQPAVASAILKEQAEQLLFDYTQVRDSASKANLLSSIRPLQNLHAGVRYVDIDLVEKLLVVYSDNHFDRELVDSFLQFLQSAPESPEVLQWVRYALDSAEHCNRTEEVEDAIRHVVRFHPNLKTTGQLNALMQAWEERRRARETW